MYDIKLFFPCEIEQENTPKQKKYKKINVELNNSSNIKLNSPIIKMATLPNVALLSSYGDVNVFLNSCNLNGLLACEFKISEVTAPYGIVLTANKVSLDKIKEIINVIKSNFLPCSVGRDEKNNRPEWLVYDIPIIMIEAVHNEKQSRKNMQKKFNIDKSQIAELENVKIHIRDNIIFCLTPLNEIENLIYDVIRVFMAIKNLWCYIRLESNKLGSRSIMSDEKKKERLLKLHECCSVFEEISYPVIFYNRVQKDFYNLLKRFFDIDSMRRQVAAAKEQVDYVITHYLNKKASSINTIVFVTGYIGVILAFLAFIPLEIRDIVWISKPVVPFLKVFIYISAISLFVWMCNLLSHKYDEYFECKTSDEKEKQMKIFNIIMLVILLLIIGVMGYLIGNHCLMYI